MITEIEKEREVGAGGYKRRFAGPTLDLTVYFDLAGEFITFRLIFDRKSDPAAIDWKESCGFHRDSTSAEYRDPSILLELPEFRKNLVEELTAEGRLIDGSIIKFISEKLAAY